MGELFLAVLNLSLTARYVILFVMLIRLPLKKLPNLFPMHYGVWLLFDS
jgi:beta-lactamase regulating signal transducer with metallopeptidase domain